MPRKQRPHRPKVKGCYECSQRRINCDRGEPECAKCTSKNLKCSGLGIRHRFNAGVAARGKWAGKTVQSIYTELGSTSLSGNEYAAEPISSRKRAQVSELFASRRRRNSSRNNDEQEQNFNSLEGVEGLTPETARNNLSAHNIVDEGAASEYSILTIAYSPVQKQHREPDESVNIASEEVSSSPRRGYLLSALFQPSPDSIPLWQRVLLLNFSENIANQMVAIDGLHNGWRHLVLPLAHTDELVMNAVLAASAFHLSINETTKSRHFSRTPTMPAVLTDTRLCTLPSQQQHPNSTTLYAYTIMGLQQRQELGDSIHGMDRHIVLLTILVLLVAVMITGSDDFPILLRMLQSAFEAIGGEEGLGRGVLAEFMIRQIHKMRVYAAPFVSEESGLATLSSLEQTTQGLECLHHCSQQRPDAAAAVPLIANLVQQAHDIYLWQALRGPPSCSPLSHPSSTMAGQTPPPSTVLVQRFKETLEAFPRGSPGEQVLIWASFIAASDAVTAEHRAFFADVFLRYFVRSGFVNVLSGLQQLRRIWARRGDKDCEGGSSSISRWTSLLPQARVFVI